MHDLRAATVRFTGQVALVTGAAHGIGRAIALRFASEGARVAIVDVDEAGANETAKLVAAAGSEACVITMDVAKPDAALRILAPVESRFGRLDALVANAGINVFRGVESCTSADWQRCIDVNLRSVVDLSRAATPLLVASKRGAIVAIASVHAERTSPGIFPYNVSKAGLVALVQSLALELGPRGVRANAILPGYVRTKAEPDLFKGRPDALARYEA
ncbi:MAG: SDR family NAD(P)-dependent oxidoreductase, partial [Planctomycetes bacterium]|nr:SDR family NAD(P)-dependent oxidoreductase [Planctomycetota bacterium]